MSEVWLVCLSGGAGGAEHHVLALARALQDLVDVRVVSVAGGWLEQAARKADLETSSVSEPRGNFDLSVLRSLRTLLRAGEPDILHSHLGRSDWYCWLSSFGASRVRLVSTEHGISADRPELYGRALSQALHRAGHRARLRRTAATIAVSEYTAAALMERYPSLRGSRPVVIRPGVRVEDYRVARVDRPHAPGHLRAVSIGRLAREKGMDVAVEAVALAVARGAEVTLDVVGEGPERNTLATLVKARGLAGRVKLLGYVEGVAEVLKEADLLVLASRSENLPLVLLECLAAGIPVVAADVGGVREVVADGVTGLLVPSEDADALATALVRLCEVPATVAALSSGSTAANANVSLRDMAASTAEVYARVAGS